MRLGYSSLESSYLSNIGHSGSTDTTLIADFKRNLGTRYQLLLAEFNSYLTTKTQTASTVAAQQYYHYPPGIVSVEDVYITIGDVKYPLDIVNSEHQWNIFNALTVQASAIPSLIFPRRDDFGIYPIPQDAYTITFSYHLRDRNLLTADYTTGTVTVTQNDATITHSSTGFVAGMVGRWFQVTTNNQDAYWYRIASFTSTSAMELESVYEGASGAGLAFNIAETPEIPEELHELLVEGATADFYAGPRNDMVAATWWNNRFWTGDGNNNKRDVPSAVGGVLGAKRRYAQRADKRIIYRKPRVLYGYDSKLWATVIS